MFLVLAGFAAPVARDSGDAFQYLFGGPGREVGDAVRQTRDGGYVVVGYTSSYGPGGHDAYLIRTDAWARRSGPTSSAARTASGGGRCVRPPSIQWKRCGENSNPYHKPNRASSCANRGSVLSASAVGSALMYVRLPGSSK